MVRVLETGVYGDMFRVKYVGNNNNNNNNTNTTKYPMIVGQSLLTETPVKPERVAPAPTPAAPLTTKDKFPIGTEGYVSTTAVYGRKGERLRIISINPPRYGDTELHVEYTNTGKKDNIRPKDFTTSAPTEENLTKIAKNEEQRVRNIEEQARRREEESRIAKQEKKRQNNAAAYSQKLSKEYEARLANEWAKMTPEQRAAAEKINRRVREENKREYYAGQTYGPHYQLGDYHGGKRTRKSRKNRKSSRKRKTRRN